MPIRSTGGTIHLLEKYNKSIDSPLKLLFKTMLEDGTFPED